MDNGMFRTSTRTVGDVAGVFESDGDVIYFYLCDLMRQKGKQVVSALYVSAGNPDFQESDVSIKWDKSQQIVGLYIRGRLWGALDLQGQKYGGHYRPGKLPEIPAEVLGAFQDERSDIRDV
jgi:hypothetical protein